MNEKRFGLGKQITLLVILVSLLIFTSSVIIASINIRNSLMTESEAKIDEVTELALNVVDGYYQRAKAGEFSQQKAQELALKDLQKFRYQGEHKNYVWVNDLDTKFLVHPMFGSGTDGSQILDKQGKPFFSLLTQAAKSGKKEYISYKWTKVGQSKDKIYPKISVSREFTPWGWVIATGVYVDEIDLLVVRALLSTLAINFIVVLLTIVLLRQTFVKNLVSYMDRLSGDLGNTSGQVSQASFHLDSASQKLAEGTTEQAAAIQEVSATLEETSSMVQKNNENTDQAAKLARKAKDSAYNSNLEMSKMMESMEKLKVSSNQISKIIKVIDEIAFQTNILALNAAVEAARAGDAGKGFAVVAEEVRNLAQRSTQSAKDTTDLIENNISLSEQGVDLAKSVYDSVTGIDSEAKKVSDLLDEIAVATKEQALGVEQIHKAISQMESVMQNNAGTADDTASASQELYAQTSSMNDIVDRLSLFVYGSDSANVLNKPNPQPRLTNVQTPYKTHKPGRLASQKIDPEKLLPLHDNNDLSNF